MDRIAVSIGSNLGDRVAHLDHAVSRLRSLLRHLRVSIYHPTAPVGVVGPQPMYLNAAAIGFSELPPRDLLDAFLGIEQERGRERPAPNAPRTLDLDLILYGDRVMTEPGLVIPHPRFRERRFVLEPLVELDPELVDPVSGLTVAALLRKL